MSITITLGRDEASGALAEVHQKLTSGRRQLMADIGVRAEKELKAWWVRRDAENPNKMGWPRQHFWSRIAQRTNFDASKTTDNTATVAVSDTALAAKINGATIKPISPRKFLAIPMHPAAYGVLPRSGAITGLFFIRATVGNGGFLVRKEGAGKVNLTFYYRLVASVTVPKDPAALPPAAQLGAALGETALDFFRRRGAGGAIPQSGGAN